MFAVCEDFSALYPRIIQSYNISFDNLIGVAKNEEEKQRYIKEGYFVSVNNNVYKNDKPYTLKRLQTKLLSGRYDYKDLQFEVYLNIIPILDEELKRRNITIDKDKLYV